MTLFSYYNYCSPPSNVIQAFSVGTLMDDMPEKDTPFEASCERVGTRLALNRGPSDIFVRWRMKSLL